MVPEQPIDWLVQQSFGGQQWIGGTVPKIDWLVLINYWVLVINQLVLLIDYWVLVHVID